jgi:glyoxylase I family protein
MNRMPFSHIALNCQDPFSLERFYTKYFGFKRARVYAPGPDQVVMIKSENLYLELFKSTGPSPRGLPEKDGFTETGYRHLAFKVDDLDAALAELSDAVEPRLGPIDMSQFIPGMRTAWVADPEGNIIELAQGYVDEENPPALD